MSNLSKLSASQISGVTRSPLRLTKRYGGHWATMLPTLRSSLALLMALLLPCWQVESLAQQQAAPMQLGHPGQDYSGQLQSDDPAYSPQQAYPAVAPTYQTPQASPYQEQTYPQQSNPQAIQPLAADRLQQLVAPIALYPDSLIGLLLTASTYPAQVQDADAWLHSQGNVPSEQIAAGANVQNWDPSVKALTAFPQVLALMDQNLPVDYGSGHCLFQSAIRRAGGGAGNAGKGPSGRQLAAYSSGSGELRRRQHSSRAGESAGRLRACL